MNIKFNPEIMAQLDKVSGLLEVMGAEGDKLIDDFLLASGKILQNEVIKNIDTILTKTTLAQRQSSIAKFGRARDKIKLGEVREGKKGRYIVTGILGSDNSDQFYLKFAEYGSKKQPATPIFRPAMIAKEKAIEALFEAMVLEPILKRWG